MFRNAFRSDGPLMLTMGEITDCIFLSLFWVLGCFPVVTVGAAGAALYDSVYRGFRDGEKRPWGRFYQVFRQNIRAGILPGLLYLAVAYGLARLDIAAWNAAVGGNLSWMLFSACALLSAAVLGVFSLLFPVLSRFENSFPALVRNTVLLGLSNLPRTLVIGILNGLSAVLCLRYVFPLFFLPALVNLIQSWLVEPMLRPYMS